MASNQAWFQKNLTVSSTGHCITWSVGKHRLEEWIQSDGVSTEYCVGVELVSGDKYNITVTGPDCYLLCYIVISSGTKE